MSETTYYTPFSIQNDENIIWRYMDFTKFVSLLDKKSLFFCRSDKLGDPFEGSLAIPDTEIFKKELIEKLVIQGKWGIEKLNQLLKEISEGNKSLKQFVNISSWYMKEHESAAMWNIYTRSNEAVAIKSTTRHLQESLPKYSQLLIGKVQYIDYKLESIPAKYITDRFFYKRKSFEYEEEVRAVLLNFNTDWLSTIEAVEVDSGVYVRAKLDRLIDEIYVAPNSPSWFKELVENIIKLYDVQKNVVRTSLDDKELY